MSSTALTATLPHLETPKDIAIKGVKTRPEESSTVMHNFTPISGTDAEIAVPERKYTCLKLSIRQNAIL